MKGKKSLGKIVLAFIGLAMLLSMESTIKPLEAQVLDKANGQQVKERMAHEEWSNFQNRYPDGRWRIEWDKKTVTPQKISGGSIKASDFGIATVTEENMDALAKSFIGANESLLKIKHSNLELVKRHGKKALKIVSYRQLYSKIPVFNSAVTLAVKNNKIVQFKANHHTDISISTTPSITKEEAANIARGFYHVKDKSKKSKDPGLIIYPLTTGGDYALTYEVTLPVMENPSKEKEKEKPYIQLTVYVDANTGAIRDVIDNLVYADLSGTVTGMILSYPPL